MTKRGKIIYEHLLNYQKFFDYSCKYDEFE